MSAEFLLTTLTLAVFAVYGLFAASVRKQVLARPRVVTAVRRTFGGAFVLLAGRLAVTDR